jgi:TPR repeat protein
MKIKIIITSLFLLCYLSANAESTFQIMLQKAKNGDAMAQNNVAAYYKEAGDCESAYYWYTQAIRQNDPIALYGMGQCHAMGCGTEINYRLAALYFRMAADKGVREAQLVLSEMYERGIGVAQDYSQAVYWRNKANNY